MFRAFHEKCCPLFWRNQSLISDNVDTGDFVDAFVDENVSWLEVAMNDALFD